MGVKTVEIRMHDDGKMEIVAHGVQNPIEVRLILQQADSAIQQKTNSKSVIEVVPGSAAPFIKQG